MLDSQSAQLGKISNRWPFSELVVVKDSEYREWEKERGGGMGWGEKKRDGGGRNKGERKKEGGGGGRGKGEELRKV